MSAPQQQDPQIFGMSLGAEPKKVAALGVLIVIGLIGWWMNRDDSASSQPAPSSQSSTRTPPKIKAMADPDSIIGAGPAGSTRKRQGSRQALGGSLKEFKVSLKPDKDNPIDPSKVDPTLRLAALARAQGTGMTGGTRSLFDFSTAPVTTEAKPGSVIIKPKPLEVAVYGPQKPGPVPPPPPPPPAPPIPLKFYGFINTARGAAKRAFFMENEDIFIASEGEMVKGRYKLVKIGVNTVVMEDTQFKSQQTVKLTDEAQSTN